MKETTMDVRDLNLGNLQSQNTRDSALGMNDTNDTNNESLQARAPQNLYIPQTQSVKSPLESADSKTHNPQSYENQTQDLKDFQTSQNSQDSIKEALVKDLDDNGLGVRELVFGFCLFFGALALFFPKIYLANSIYYLSKDIASLQTTREILSEEHKKLRREREDIEFLFGVLDNLAR
ncbi:MULTISPECIES: hypothetical protein [unclassified Helicobacter]|uniref:hypothetical protein n=1 Tax=unclassified Helicobacter TaxID=2593540 RepID=UPI0011C077CD|nr:MULTISPECIES: hypothetical protein [unclassified Helicobacter]